ncbi:putative pet100 [Lyophyllum shimeji]|uniref:Pet100 n=1 Tax=Lyophyllum shimeji TaxID=47721 RepID=A0A9P3UL72_LYOSH|nr:putative pet100 [Lyophyllum shimeji]
MGGPNLEVFKFSLYLFVPIAALVHFGDPDWYREHVVPYRDKLFPPAERTLQRIPKDQSAIREELNRIRAERLARKAREAEEQN